MKRIFGIALAAALFSCSAPAIAQTQDTMTVGQDLKKAGRKVGHAGKKAGQKAASVTRKGAAHVADKVYEGKAGPNGETVYINNHSRYYYIDNRGRRIFMNAADLRDK